MNVWEWRRLDRTALTVLTQGLDAAAAAGGTGMTIDATYLVDISEIPDLQTRTAADHDYRQRLRKYARAAVARGLSVSIVVGTPSWASTDALYVADLVVQWVSRYNASVAAPLQVAAVEVDVEPWGTPEWVTGDVAVRHDMLRRWLEFVAATSDAIRALPSPQQLPVRVDVPAWFDGTSALPPLTFRGVNDSAVGHVFRLLDTGAVGNAVVVMAYKDTVDGPGGSAAATATEFEIAARHGDRVAVIIGQETAAVPGEPETVTFFEEGWPALQQAMTDLTTWYAPRPVFAGFSIDHAAALQAWHP